jgi:autotransporter-associated beta strand protein
MKSKKLRLLSAALSVALPAVAGAQTWNNFVGGNFNVATNWLPSGVPTSSVDTALTFGSSSLQTGGGYTVGTNSGAAFDLNSITLNSLAASNPSIVIQGNAAADTLRFNVSSSGANPFIRQDGTGRVILQNGSSTSLITLNSANLQILGTGIGELQLIGTIAQTGTGNGLTINQTGTLPNATGSLVRLGGANTGFSGGVTLTAGNLVLSSASGLGTGTFVVNGGTLQADPGSTLGIAVANNVTLNSTLNITGNNNTSGSSVATHITFSGNFGGAGGINVANTGTNLNTGTFTTMAYAFTGSNSFTGGVAVLPIGNSSSLVTVGTATAGTGSFAGTTSLDARYAGTIRLDNTTAVATRLGSAPTLNLGGGGSFQILGNSTASASETLGAFTLSGGASVTILGASATAQTTTARFSSLNRVNKGTLFLVGTNLGSGTGAGESIVNVTAAPSGAVGGGGAAGTTNVSILPYVFVNAASSTTAATANVNSGFARYDAASQRIVPLAASEYASNLYLTGTSAPTNNIRLRSTSTTPTAFGVAGLNSPTTVNSLVLDTNTAATVRVGTSVSGSGTLTVAGGAIASTVSGGTGGTSNPSLINLGGLNFGGTTGHFHNFLALTVNAPISGSAGVVKGAGGTLLLTGNNTFTGGLTVNSGLVQFNSNANLGAAGEPITLQAGSGGGIQYLPSNLFAPSFANSATVNRPISIESSGSQIGVTLLNTSLTLSGSISGSGQLYKGGSGVLRLTGNNSSYTGTIVTFGGVVAAQNDAALGGTGATINLTNGYLQPLTSFATSKDILISGLSAFIYTGGQNLTINGNISSQNAGATLFKLGEGDLIVNSTIAHYGQFQLGASNPTSSTIATTGNGVQTFGRLILQSANGGMPLASSVFSIGNAELVLDNTSAVNNNRIGSVTVSVTGGNFTLKGNSSAPVSETIGAISFSNANNPYGGVITLDTPTGSGQSTTLTALSLSANSAGGTITVRGTGLGASTGDRSALLLATNPTLANSVVPSLVVSTSATGEATDFATTVAAGSQFAVVPFTAYTAGGALGTGSSSATYDVTAPTTFTGLSTFANALRIRGSTVDLGGSTLALGAAHVLSTGGAAGSISNGTLSFGATTARVSVTSGSDLTVSATLSGTGGLVKTGAGTLTLNTAASVTVAAGTSFFGVGQGTLKYGVNNALGTASTTANVFINSGATLDINGTTSTVGNINGYGNVNLGTNGTLTLGSIAQIVQFGGSLLGSGTLIKTGSGITTALAGDSTVSGGFTGGVQVLGGTLSVQTPGALGTGTSPILLGATTGSTQALLVLGAPITTFSRDITVQAGSAPTAAHTITAPAGVLTLSSNIVVNNVGVTYTSGGYTATGVGLQLSGTTGSAGGMITQTGTISGAGGIVVFGGNWGFNGNNTYTGGTFVDTATTGAISVGSDSVVSGSTIVSGPFGTGPVAFSTLFGSNLRADGGARTIANVIRLSSTGGHFGTAGSNPLTFTGAVDLQGATVAQSFHIMSTALVTFAGGIQNGNGILKNGPGTLALTVASTYTGGTTVNAGTLLVNNTAGSATGTGAITVNSGAILGGSGIVSGSINVSSGGVLAPGNSPGVLTSAGSLTLSDGSVFSVELTGTTAGSGYDQALLTGGSSTYALGTTTGAALVFPTLSGSYTAGDFFAIIRNDAATPNTGVGFFTGLPTSGSTVTALGSFGGVASWEIYYNANVDSTGALLGTSGGNDVVLLAVPEPTTLGVIGAASLIALRRRSTKRA